MKEKRRHEQECKKLKQRVVELEESLKDEKVQRDETRHENEKRVKKMQEEKKRLDELVKDLNAKLELQKKAR